MSHAEQEFRALAHLLGRYAPKERELIVSTFGETPSRSRSGWVITVAGTPPRGTFIVFAETEVASQVFYITPDMRRTRRLQGKQMETVFGFLNEWLTRQADPFFPEK